MKPRKPGAASVKKAASVTAPRAAGARRAKADAGADAPRRGRSAPELSEELERSPRAAARPDAIGIESAPADATSDLTPFVGANLKRFRGERGLSLERLSKVSGVSRAMLGQIELGQSTPTINVLWKIARALGVPFSALISQQTAPGTMVMSAARAKVLRSHDGSFSSRALFPMDRPRTVEFYQLRLAPLAVEHADPHPPGTTENLVVSQGKLEITVASDRRLLEEGDAIVFEADVPHVYRNPEGAEAVMYLVMTYSQRV